MDEARSLEICVLGSTESIHTRNRAATLAARGHVVTLAAPSVESLTPIERRVVRALSKLPTIAGLATIYTRLQHLRRLHGDIFHVQYAAGADAWLAAIAGLQPLVVSVWGGDVLFGEQGNASPLARRLTRDLLSAADLVTAESQRMIQVVLGLCPDARVARIHWGIDIETFRRRESDALRQRLGIPAGVTVLFSPKLLDRFYNIDLIIDAMPLIVRQHAGTRLLIGTFRADQAYRRELVERATALGVRENVIFLPPLDEPDIVAVYGISDLVITIPPSDGVPRTLMEASACAVPSILSDLPAYAEFVKHEETALLVPIAPETVAAAVLRLLHDPALYERLRRNAEALARQQFDRRNEACRVEALYRDLLSRPRQRRSRLKRAAMLGRLLLHFGLHL